MYVLLLAGHLRSIKYRMAHFSIFRPNGQGKLGRGRRTVTRRLLLPSDQAQGHSRTIDQQLQKQQAHRLVPAISAVMGERLRMSRASFD